jgi:hypothetical protein
MILGLGFGAGGRRGVPLYMVIWPLGPWGHRAPAVPAVLTGRARAMPRARVAAQARLGASGRAGTGTPATMPGWASGRANGLQAAISNVLSHISTQARLFLGLLVGMQLYASICFHVNSSYPGPGA